MKGLDKLAVLYERVERMQAALARTAADHAAVVARELAFEHTCLQDQRSSARAVLSASDPSARPLAAAAEEFAMLRAAKLTALCAQCEEAREEAMRSYMASRVKTQQVASALARRRTQQAASAQRQSQAAADDRYGSRLGWTRAQERMKSR